MMVSPKIGSWCALQFELINTGLDKMQHAGCLCISITVYSAFKRHINSDSCSAIWVILFNLCYVYKWLICGLSLSLYFRFVSCL